MNALSRRRFLKISAATFGAGAAATQIPPLTHLAHAAAPTGEVKTVPTFCEMCFWRCAGIASVRDGKVWKFEGNPVDPQSRGRLCPRGSGAPGAINDPDRLRTPLIRTGERGKEAWKTATWDEALTHVADRMQKIKGAHGPESIAMLYHGIGVRFIQHVLKSYGCINMAGASFAQCRGPRDVGFSLTFGSGLGSPEPTDIENTDCLVLIGSHLGENMHNLQVQEFSNAVARRIPIIVVDPRYSVAASKAKYWLPIKPGTDLALLLAWMNVLVTEGWHDKTFVAQYGLGFDKFVEEIKSATPEWAATETGLDPALIRTTAREFVAAPAGVADPPGPARQLVRRRRAAQPRGRAAQRAARQLGPARRHRHAERHQGRGLPAAEVPNSDKPFADNRTARSTRSPTNRSPLGSGKPPSRASRIRSRAGSSTRRTSSRRCRTAPRP